MMARKFYSSMLKCSVCIGQCQTRSCFVPIKYYSVVISHGSSVGTGASHTLSLYTVKCTVITASGVGGMASCEKIKHLKLPIWITSNKLNSTQRENLKKTLYKQIVVHLYPTRASIYKAMKIWCVVEGRR